MRFPFDRATAVRRLTLQAVLELPVPLVGPAPPIDSPPPPQKKGVEFEHLGGANKYRNKCIISARRRSASEDYLFRALQIYSLLLLLLLLLLRTVFF